MEKSDITDKFKLFSPPNHKNLLRDAYEAIW